MHARYGAAADSVDADFTGCAGCESFAAEERRMGAVGIDGLKEELRRAARRILFHAVVGFDDLNIEVRQQGGSLCGKVL